MVDYELLSDEGCVITHADLQDKTAWCKKGEVLEDRFLDVYGDEFGLVRNPSKDADPTVPDFVHSKSGLFADLKTQNTPFFGAGRYGVQPGFAVTFNQKDLELYGERYDEILLYFSVGWFVTAMRWPSGRTVRVDPLYGVWGARFSKLRALCTDDNLHRYAQRTDDRKGNARASYVLDLQKPPFRRLVCIDNEGNSES